MLYGLVFTNFNSFLSQVFGISNLATIILLGLCLFITFWLYTKEGFRFNFWLIQLVLLFLVSFIFIGTVSYLWDPSSLHTKTSLVKIYRNYLSSILMISTFYIGSKFIFYYKGFPFLLKTVLFLFLFTTLFIVIGPYIGLTSIYDRVNQAIDTGERDAGFFGNPNEAGSFANYCLVILLTSTLYFKNNKWILIVLAVLPIYAAFVSFSKAAIILTIALISFYILFNIFFFRGVGKKNRRYLVLVLGIIFFSIMTLITSFDSFYNSLERSQRQRIDALFVLAEGKIDKESTTGRSEIFEHAFYKILKRPLFGNGIGSFHRFNDGPKQLGTHNTLLLIQGESGIIPLFLFLFFVISVVLKSFTLKNRAIGFLVIGIFSVFFFSRVTFSHVALKDRISNGLIGVSLALLSIQDQKKKEMYNITSSIE